MRFAPSAFRWNGRVGVALLPSLIVLAGFGGAVPSGVMMVGAMVRLGDLGVSYFLTAQTVLVITVSSSPNKCVGAVNRQANAFWIFESRQHRDMDK